MSSGQGEHPPAKGALSHLHSSPPPQESTFPFAFLFLSTLNYKNHIFAFHSPVAFLPLRNFSQNLILDTFFQRSFSFYSAIFEMSPNSCHTLLSFVSLLLSIQLSPLSNNNQSVTLQSPPSRTRSDPKWPTGARKLNVKPLCCYGTTTFLAWHGKHLPSVSPPIYCTQHTNTRPTPQHQLRCDSLSFSTTLLASTVVSGELLLLQVTPCRPVLTIRWMTEHQQQQCQQLNTRKTDGWRLSLFHQNPHRHEQYRMRHSGSEWKTRFDDQSIRFGGDRGNLRLHNNNSSLSKHPVKFYWMNETENLYL